MERAIETRGLCYAFGKGQARTQVLFDVDLTIDRGEVIVLKGASGSGKTTLLTILACLRDMQDGDAMVLGEDLVGASASLQVHIRRRLGFIFQAHNLHDALTALQNVRMGLELHGGKAKGQWREAGKHLLGLLGLADRVHYKPRNLSGGQKQRVAVARALIANPDIVFADEPTAALDAESGRIVIEMLKDLAETRGTTSLIVTHDERVIRMASRVLTMDQGRLVADEKVEKDAQKELAQ
ncbi:ATP-binding cassette domain-containing protein [Thalassococcus sp. S3]|uniref:ATP-binding cassette domain-containing protein n=1 Tax=Thalassococcus sp. S3 TaxID=2017482 RepID=UPI0010244197|nr:ATP-binding cassette domain-containing protein [Thalassococcus sp. S3]QBF30179.1 ABC transporter [Thalassococcus sp. S3]